MEIYFESLYHHTLFENIPKDEFDRMMLLLAPVIKTYEKNEYVLHAGDKINGIGFVLFGAVYITRTDEHGNETMLAKIQSKEIFAEVFACAQLIYSPVSVVSEGKSAILFLDYKKLVEKSALSHTFHSVFMSNMLKIIASRTLYLNEKVDILSKKNLRDKIFAYFAYARGDVKQFEIELSREQLATFLCVNRSALSAELSKMQKEGLIRYHKNTFELFY